MSCTQRDIRDEIAGRKSRPSTDEAPMLFVPGVGKVAKLIQRPSTDEASMLFVPGVGRVSKVILR